MQKETDFLEITNEVASIYTFQSRESKIQDDVSKNHVALSPDGRFAAFFNTENYEIRLYESKDLDECITLIKFNESNLLSPYWSLAISNSINIRGTNDVLIAISCFNDNDIMSGPDENNLKRTQNVIDIETGNDGFTPSMTFVISTRNKSKIPTTIDNIGGVLHFLENHSSTAESDESNGFTNLIIMNVLGITKSKIYHKDNFSLPKSGLFNKIINAEEFYFPSIVAFNILKLYQDVSCKKFLNSSVEKNYFFAEDYKTNRVEMYNLQSYELEMTFQKREEIITSSTIGNAIFAISKNGTLLAHCHGDNSITIYLMENGLEVTTKSFYNINGIKLISFINNDEELFIIVEEEIGYHENGKVKFAPVIIIWDLFSYKSNIHKIDIKKIFPMLQGSANYSIAKSSGTIISVTDDEKIFSILHNPIIEALLNRHLRVSENLLKLSFQNIYDHSTDKFKYYHIIFQLDGKWLDARKENNRSIVVNNKEPWVHYKQYRRISAYLDEKKSIQLIIGESTVQVWRKKDRNAKSKRVLEYIWTNPGNQRILIDSLSIGKHEFSLDLKIPSKHNSMSFLGINIHWPQNTHTLKEACEALEFLHNRRNEPVGPKNQNKFESLVHDTEKLVIHIIKKYPNVWKLSEIRFNLMANLIRGHRINLIKRILFENTSLRNNVDCPIYICRNLHVPRLHDLKSSIKKSDLQIAIESSEGAHRKIVAMLLEYYSNNAMQNTGWMFTVSKVIPLLMERNLDIYIKEMFYKPCFGAKEEYLDPIFINQKELKRGYNRSVYALNVKPGLIQKQEQKSWWKKVKSVRPSFKRNKEGKPEELPVTNLRVVPLPDFTVYPEGIDKKAPKWKIPFLLTKILLKPRGYTLQEDHQRSSFLRFIRQDENEVLYDNPAMEACINFKWESARNHFIRHIILYILYAVLFGIITGVIDYKEKISYLYYFIFYYLGYYLLSKEIIQLRYDGWKYFTVYHIVDFLACVVPIISLTTFYTFKTLNLSDNSRVITITFVILLLWFELILLMRFFEKSAHYINMIVNILYGVSTFIIFILLVIIGFGHSMHFLLRHPDYISEKPSGETFETDDDSSFKFKIHQTYDLDTTSDNYYRKLPQSIIAVYFWMLGRWDQLENWNFWPITVLSIIASILLVFIMQNMLIAFMTGVFDETKSNVKQAVLKFRADLIAEYEAIEKPFGNTRGNPRYIYYVGSLESQEEWLAKAEKYKKTHKSLLDRFHKFEDDETDDDDDYIDEIDDDDDFDEKHQKHHYRGDTSISNIEEEELFVNDGKISKSKEKQKLKDCQNNLEEKINDITNRISSVEENLKELIKLVKERK
ncbi:unnamed protein product [Rhizophagus irregularis]|nr:unnamed protein product [Rhizophagus irregularis]